jgi:hypothetical protein
MFLVRIASATHCSARRNYPPYLGPARYFQERCEITGLRSGPVQPEKRAHATVFQDGGGFVKDTGKAPVPIVFDKLIQRHEMPETIGILINPGVLPAPATAEQNHYNRTFE